MTEEQLRRIKERATKALPCVWYYDADNADLLEISTGRFAKRVLADVNTGEFIARSRRDVLSLVAEVERLQSALQNTSLVGRTLTDDYCNGFFGGHTFNLKGARVCEESDLIVMVRRKDGRYFEADFDSKAQKNELMTKWTSTKGEQ